ncbi:hypothetical protein KEM52_003543, partial [Ascosphaera acerosa]
IPGGPRRAVRQGARRVRWRVAREAHGEGFAGVPGRPSPHRGERQAEGRSRGSGGGVLQQQGRV